MTMPSEEFIPLLSILHTKTQADSLVRDLDNLRQNLFSTQGNLTDKVSTFLSHEYKEAVMTIFRKRSANDDNMSILQKLLDDLIENIRSLKVISIEFATDLKDTTIQKVSAWLDSTSKEKILLEIQVNRELVGGISLNLDGVHREFSVRKQLIEKFKKNEMHALLKD